MPHIPADRPERCPVCDAVYDSISEHAEGIMVGLNDNELYQRVCFEPHTAENEARIRFYHHTHEQAEASESDR